MDPQWGKIFSRPAVASTSRKRSNSKQRQSSKKSKHDYEVSEDEKNLDNEIDELPN